MVRHETGTTTSNERTRRGRALRLGLKAAGVALSATLLGTGAADPSCGAHGPKVADHFSCTAEYDTKNLQFVAAANGDQTISVADVSTHFHIEANDVHGIRPAVNADMAGTFSYKLSAFNDQLSSRGEIQISHGAAAIIQDTVNFERGTYAGQSVVCTTNNVRL